MEYNCFDKPIKPKWLGVDIKGSGLYVCPICNRVIRENTEACTSCGQKFTYEKGETK